MSSALPLGVIFLSEKIPTFVCSTGLVSFLYTQKPPLLIIRSQVLTPLQTSNDALLLLGRLEGGVGDDGADNVLLRSRRGLDDLLSGLLPRDSLLEERLLLVAEETNVDKDLDELWEALVAKSLRPSPKISVSAQFQTKPLILFSDCPPPTVRMQTYTTDNVVRLRNLVALLVRGRVTVGVRNKRETGVDEVGLGGSHQLRPSDVGDLAVLVEAGGVPEREQHTPAGPAELVTERVVGRLRGGQAAAVAEEGLDLAAGGVHLLDGLDGVQVVDARVQTDLVHDRDAGVLGGLVELHHGGGDV